jgi:hypothetical protein
VGTAGAGAGAGAAGGGLVAGGLKHSAADEAVGVLVVPPLGQSVRVAPSAVATAHIKHWQSLHDACKQAWHRSGWVSWVWFFIVSAAAL